MSELLCNKAPMTRFVDEAEKEASEVLHSLLSVERIEKPSNLQNIQHQVVVLTNPSEAVQWQHHVYHQEYQQYEKSGDWEHTVAVDVETSTCEDEHLIMEDVPTQTYALEETVKNEVPQNKNNKGVVKRTGHKWKKKVAKSASKGAIISESSVEENTGSDDVNDVRQRFRLGCECHDVSCFKGLNPDNVYRHRLNIAELTKEEHDMYLMGVTMACMSDPGVTVKQRERRRLRAQYVYQGRRVCLSAFLYLENCTLYQLKRIRKHVMTHGVTPRVHGNHGKKPHNVFSLETYTRATDFLKNYIGYHTSSNGNCKNTVVFPSEVSRKTIHNEYQMYMRKCAPDEKTMGYSTFRHFMKEQFPHVKFCKAELGSVNVNNSTSSSSKQQVQQPANTHRSTNTEPVVSAAPAPVQGVAVPLTVIQDQGKPEVAAHTTYIVTPVTQLVPAHTITIPYTNYAFASIS